MTDRQIEQIHEQLSDGTKVIHAYRALEDE